MTSQSPDSKSKLLKSKLIVGKKQDFENSGTKDFRLKSYNGGFLSWILKNSMPIHELVSNIWPYFDHYHKLFIFGSELEKFQSKPKNFHSTHLLWNDRVPAEISASHETVGEIHCQNGLSKKFIKTNRWILISFHSITEHLGSTIPHRAFSREVTQIFVNSYWDFTTVKVGIRFKFFDFSKYAFAWPLFQK